MVWTDENNDVVILLFGTSILILLVIGFISFYLVYQKRLLKEVNHVQSLELDLQRRVMAAIIDTQEIERKRLAEDLHDELGALILALKLSNHQLLNEKEDETRVERILNNESLIESIAHRVRDVSHNLLPSSLKRGHFEQALQALCKMFDENTELNFHFERDEVDVKIEQKDQISLYRTFNEWLANVVKHSKSKNVWMEMHKNGQFYVFNIMDDGIGFDYAKSISTNKGLGLVSMDGRLKQMNTTFQFKKNKDKGTHFEIKYPIDSTLV